MSADENANILSRSIARDQRCAAFECKFYTFHLDFDGRWLISTGAKQMYIFDLQNESNSYLITITCSGTIVDLGAGQIIYCKRYDIYVYNIKNQ